MSKPKGIRVVVVVSDVHCGSTLAILPEGFETVEGNPVPFNATQKWLHACWRDATESWLPDVLGGADHALVLNGDLREGVHHGTKQVISPDPADHDAAAVQLLAPLAERAAKTFVTLGTESHTGGGEHAIAKQLKAVPPPGGGRAWAWDRLDITIAGVRCVFQHHIQTSARLHLRSSALGIHLANEQGEAANNGEVLPRVVGCAHRHTFDLYQRPNAMCFTTPAWQVLTRFGHKVVPAARCKPGMVVLDWRDKDDGELPEVHVRTYRPPASPSLSL